MAQGSINELARLANAAGAQVAGKIVQQLPVPSNPYYVGKGKLEELLALKKNDDYTILILDDELSPAQQRNLEDALQVVDRGGALELDRYVSLGYGYIWIRGSDRAILD